MIRLASWIKNLKFNRDMVLFVLVLVVLAFLLTELIMKNSKSSAGIKTLVFTYYWEGMEETLNTLKNEYEELFNDVKITLNYIPYETYNTDIISDIYALDSLKLNEFLEQETIEPEVFTLLRFFHPLFYNIDILEKNGFNRPPKTRTEFLTQAREIAGSESGIYAIAMALEDNNARGFMRDVYSWIWAAGTITPADRIEREILEFFSILESEELLFPGAFNMGENEKRDAFINGKTAFMIGTAEDMELLRHSMGAVLDYTAIPVPDTYIGRPIFASGSWNLGVKYESTHRDEALSFIDFLTEHSSRLAKDWAIPVNGNLSITQDPFYLKARELYISGDLMDEHVYNTLSHTIISPGDLSSLRLPQ